MKLKLDDYDSWLSGELERLVRPAESKGSKLLEESRRAFDEARRFFDDLARKGDRDMASKRDPESYRAARVIGRSAREAAGTLVGVEVPVEVSWDSLKGFKNSLSSLSRSLREIRNGAAGELAGLYILDMRSFGGVIDRIAKSGERLSQFLEGEGSTLQKARNLSGILEDLQGARKELADQEQEEKSLTQDSQALSSRIAELSLRIGGLEADAQLHELLNTGRELRNESQRFRTESLAHLQRPIRKLRDLSTRGEIPLAPDDREALEAFIRSPYRSLLSRSTGSQLRKILESLKVALDSGKMGFKPRKTGRVQAQLNELLSTQVLVTVQAKGRQLLSRRWKLMQSPACKGLYQDRKDLLEKLEDAKHKEESLAEKTRTVREKSGSLVKRLDELLVMAQAKTSEYMGMDVQIEKPVEVSSR